MLNDSLQVPVTTIDALCQEHGIDSIDFIKIDVQGAEGKAILGASSILQNSADCIILSEFWPYGLERYGSDLHSYVENLQALGFQLFKLENKGKLSPLNVDTIAHQYSGRKYTNIVGLKGKYSMAADSRGDDDRNP